MVNELSSLSKLCVDIHIYTNSFGLLAFIIALFSVKTSKWHKQFGIAAILIVSFSLVVLMPYAIETNDFGLSFLVILIIFNFGYAWLDIKPSVRYSTKVNLNRFAILIMSSFLMYSLLSESLFKNSRVPYKVVLMFSIVQIAVCVISLYFNRYVAHLNKMAWAVVLMTTGVGFRNLADWVGVDYLFSIYLGIILVTFIMMNIVWSSCWRGHVGNQKG